MLEPANNLSQEHNMILSNTLLSFIQTSKKRLLMFLALYL